MAITTRSTRAILGSKHPGSTTTSVDVPIPSAKPALTLDDIVIPKGGYRYPREGEVPAGYYVSVIDSIEVREKNGKTLLDVCYEIEGCDYQNRGKVFRIKQTYPLGSDHATDFFDAIVAAGVKPGPNLKDAIGVTEWIRLGYLSNKSDLGSIVERKPYRDDDVEEDDDSEFDGMLPDDEEEE